jgi:hypothetical protein
MAAGDTYRSEVARRARYRFPSKSETSPGQVSDKSPTSLKDVSDMS